MAESGLVKHRELDPKKENLQKFLISQYHLSDETKLKETGEKYIEIYDPKVSGIVGVNFEDINAPYTYFFPNEDPIVYPLDREQMIHVARKIHSEQPKTKKEMQSPYIMLKGVMFHLAKSEKLKQSGIIVQAQLKKAGSVELIQMNYHGYGLIARIPLWLNLNEDADLAAFDPVSQAIAIGRLATSLNLKNQKICVPYAIGISQLIPLYSGKPTKGKDLGKKVFDAFNYKERPDFNGFIMGGENEHFIIDKGDKKVDIYIDVLDERYTSPKLSTTQRLLNEVLTSSNL